MRVNNLTKLRHKKAFVSIFAIFFSAIVVSVLTAMYVLLVKQIEIINLDYASFQSLYTADSVFECIIYKESTATGTTSIFYPANQGNLGFCGSSGDLSWRFPPEVTNGRSFSTIQMTFNTAQGDFCGFAVTRKQVDEAEFTNGILFYGQSRECDDTSSRVVERLIDFVY